MISARVTLIAAVSDDGFISSGEGVPWDLPADRAHFRAVTASQCLLLGRKTYLEMLGWFEGHFPLVLTRDAAFHAEIGVRVPSVQMALMQAARRNYRELYVCGGGQCYAAAMPFADRLMITRVHTKLGEGVPFPAFKDSEWTEEERSEHPADEQHAHAMTFLTLVRRRR